jgi:hypothetical protein
MSTTSVVKNEELTDEELVRGFGRSSGANPTTFKIYSYTFFTSEKQLL